MLNIVFIRHGATKGNIEKRYLGTTDEDILPESVEELSKKSFPLADVVYVSPMKRCIQTAEIIYPNQEYTQIEDFRECDFGEFEGKNYIELGGNEKYQQWIDSDGKLPFPGGESVEEFKNRCVDAFYEILVDTMAVGNNTTIAVVAHGGTIMAIMEYFAKPEMDYYSWSVDNGCGFYTVAINENEIRVERKIA